MMRSVFRHHQMFALLAAVHLAMLAWCAYRYSPTYDEVGHLPAGLRIWQTGKFDIYRVNPPLVKAVAAAPAAAVGAEANWDGVDERPLERHEWGVGRRFFAESGTAGRRYLVYGRWLCGLFSVIGLVICYTWANELYGRPCGLVAAALWAFCPNLIAHGSLITADVAAASLGALASYLFWRWLRQPSWHAALGVGLALGVAQLAKSSLLLLYPLWIVLLLVYRWRSSSPPLGHALLALAAMFLLSLAVLNLGYGLSGSFARLDSYTFVSQMFSGTEGQGNRFAALSLGKLPVPLPADYVQGIDFQRRDFERFRMSYLGGEWYSGGAWDYYLYGLSVKLPAGTLVLIVLAAIISSSGVARHAGRDEWFVLLSAVALLAFVSSQTGINSHVRYAWPVLPYAFIWCSQVGLCVRGRWPVLSRVAMASLTWTAVSGLMVCPHSLSYFNELAGGPRHGHLHLLDSNIDWQQDALYLRDWARAHPDARPLYYIYHGICPPEVCEVPSEAPPDPWARRLPPGWYAVSVDRLFERNSRWRELLGEEPLERVGYSIWIFHVEEP